MSLYDDNQKLNRLEYEQRHVYLYSRPRCVGLVLGNACNLNCIHCYQAKNNNQLLAPAVIGGELRRELAAFYPYASSLRILGGEVLALDGFRELVEDVAAVVERPVLSISTNGTLIDDAWAECFVRTPFSNITVSIDGATRSTYNRLRQGGDLEQVLCNIGRIREWKAKLGSQRPYLDSFFVVMRSNFREIPQYLELVSEHGMIGAALQTMELSPENLARVPTLGVDEAISEHREVLELHTILQETLPRFAGKLQVRVSGLRSLFEAYGLSGAFLEEDGKSLYPESDGLGCGSFELCPNPWTTLFVAENGDAHLCFLAQPVGNLYADSLAAIWNGPCAVAKRRDLVAGRYVASGCSSQYCAWREGKIAPPSEDGAQEWRDLAETWPSETQGDVLALVRKRVAAERRKTGEAEETAAQQINHLEAKAAKAVADFCNLDAVFRKYREPWLVRLAHRIATLFDATAWKLRAH